MKKLTDESLKKVNGGRKHVTCKPAPMPKKRSSISKVLSAGKKVSTPTKTPSYISKPTTSSKTTSTSSRTSSRTTK